MLEFFNFEDLLFASYHAGVVDIGNRVVQVIIFKHVAALVRLLLFHRNLVPQK